MLRGVDLVKFDNALILDEWSGVTGEVECSWRDNWIETQTATATDIPEESTEDDAINIHTKATQSSKTILNRNQFTNIDPRTNPTELTRTQRRPTNED